MSVGGISGILNLSNTSAILTLQLTNVSKVLADNSVFSVSNFEGNSILARSKFLTAESNANLYTSVANNLDSVSSELSTLDELYDTLEEDIQDMIDLATTTSSSGYSATRETEFNAIQSAFNSLVGTGRISNTQVLNTSSGSVSVTINPISGGSISLNKVDLTAETLKIDATGTVGTDAVSISSQSNATNSLTLLNTALTTVQAAHAAMTGFSNIVSTLESLNTTQATNQTAIAEIYKTPDTAALSAQVVALQLQLETISSLQASLISTLRNQASLISSVLSQ